MPDLAAESSREPTDRTGDQIMLNETGWKAATLPCYRKEWGA